MCIIKAHNAKVDYLVVKRNYFSDNSLSPETPNRDSPILFMYNSLHPELSPILIRYNLYSIFSPPFIPLQSLLPACHPLHLRFFFVFYSFASLFVFFCFRSIWLCDIRQRANWVHAFIMKECISVPGQTFVQTRKHIIYVLKQNKWTTDWPCTLVFAKKKFAFKSLKYGLWTHLRAWQGWESSSLIAEPADDVGKFSLQLPHCQCPIQKSRKLHELVNITNILNKKKL